MLIRSFLALPIPKDIANMLGDAAAKMAYQDKSNAVRWVDQSNFHVTLAFLGNQDSRALETLAEQLDAILPQNSISLELSHYSPFPEGKPKLLAAMVSLNDELKLLQQQIINAVMVSGLKIEKRRFVPHITLGRLRHSRNYFAGKFTGLTNTHFEANEVVLFESILTPNGAEYEPLYEFYLGLPDVTEDDYHIDEFNEPAEPHEK